MPSSAGRLLSLLTLLQARSDLTSGELADRLQVTTRTIRNDVQQLRDLGYPIHGTPGVAGGYRLGAGARLPPLLLDDEEAVATAIGLRTAASGSVGGIQEPALRALIKLDGVLPSRLRQQVSSLSEAISTIPTSGPVVDPAVLATVAGAIRDRELLRFDYRRHDQTSTGREAEPHRLVHASRRWYLVGWDIGQQEWRTFRVDRMRVRVPNGRRFTPRPPPTGGFERHITEGLSVHTWPIVGRFLLHAPLEQVWDRSHLTEGALTAVDDRHCLLTVGADSEAFLLIIVGIYDVNFTVLGPPSLRERAATLARRYLQASEASEVTKDGDSC